MRPGAVPGAREAGSDVVVRLAGDLFVDHAAGATAPAEHYSVGVSPHPVQDHDVARHEAKTARQEDSGARKQR